MTAEGCTHLTAGVNEAQRIATMQVGTQNTTVGIQWVKRVHDGIKEAGD